jgi:hypothetical protein
MSSDRKQIREALSSFRKSVREPNSDVQLLLEKYGAFFVNDQKKIAIYQSILVQKLQKLLVLTQTNCALNCQKEVVNFKKIVSDVRSLKSSLITIN